MGIFDRVFGGRDTPQPRQPLGGDAGSADEQAIARYRYLLRTAPPEAIEQTHAEAFAKLTPEQRRQILDELRREMPEAERVTVLPAGENPNALARLATRAEMRQPGTMERTFSRIGGGPGLGGLMAGTFLSTMAGAVLGTALAHSFIAPHLSDAPAQGAQDAAGGDGFADAGDSGAFDGGDIGGFDV